MDQENRVIVLIDMDCFYCQVEEKLDPELKGKPIAVVQYNPWRGGGIIAVNYEARAMGVTRGMRGDQAKEKCPDIQLPSVPCQRGKADITKYRDAGIEVAKVLQKFTALLERASIDEAYLDITAPVQERLKTLNPTTITAQLMPNTFALGYNSIEEFISDVHSGGGDSIDFDFEHATRLLVGAVIVSEIRASVYEETGYRCSAGIAHNKILAKLVCGMNKPNKQTVLPKHSINILYKTLSVKKVKHLGGKFGDTVCDVLKVKTMGELQKFTEKELQTRFDDKNGSWLYNIARGIDLEPVQARFNPKSIGCCKQLRGKSALIDLESLKKWLKDLGDEIEDRLEKDSLENNRTPKQMVVSFSTQLSDGRDISCSRSYNFVADDELCGDMFSNKALELILESSEAVKPVDGESNRKLKAPIKFLGISVGKFEDHNESKKIKKIKDYFGAGSSNVCKNKESTKDETKNSLTDVKPKKNEGKDYIMQKFLETADKNKNKGSKNNIDVTLPQVNASKLKEETLEGNNSYKNGETVSESANKQESFFAKFLHNGVKPLKENVNEKTIDPVIPSTPECNVVNCGEDSNDSEYSGSTINMEINKSIALFEDDPKDVEQISSLREQLLNKTNVSSEDDISDPQDADIELGQKVAEDIVDKHENDEVVQQNENVLSENAFECPECKKIIPIDMFDTHSDYHLALTLREEERQRVRNETKERNCKKAGKEQVKTNSKLKVAVVKSTIKESNKNDTVASIANFFVKMDETAPTETCSECGKKVPIEKFTEHSDFHEAQRLNRELNKKASPSYFTGNSVKRKRKTISPVKKPKLTSTRSIDSFFR